MIISRKRSQISCFVSNARDFDFGDVRSQVGQNFSTVRSADSGAELYQPDTFKGSIPLVDLDLPDADIVSGFGLGCITIFFKGD